MRSTRLQGLAVLHQSLDGISIYRAGKAFRLRLDTLNNWHSHYILSKISIYIQHFLRLSLSLLISFVSSVSLLPQKFGSAEERTGTHLPAKHIGPLVAKDRKVTIRVNPILISIPNDCFRSRSDDEFLLQLGSRVNHNLRTILIHLQTVVGDYRALLGKTLNVFGLLAEKRLGDKQRQIGIDVTSFLKTAIKLSLHLLPDSIAIRLDYHTASYSRIFSQ